MKENILFISDSSINNPILYSQGFPLFKFLNEKGFLCHLISFEKKKINIKENISFFSSVKQVIVKREFYLPDWLVMYIKGLYIARRLVRSNDIKIVHARSFNPSMIAISLKCFFNREIKVIYDNRGVFIDEQIYIGKWKNDGIKVKLARHIEKKIIYYSDAIVLVSKSFKKHLLKYSNNLALEKKIHVIPNRTKLSQKFKETFSENKKKIIGVYSGSVAPWQKIPWLIKLFKIGNQINANLYFKVITYNKDEFISIIDNSDVDLLNVEILSLDHNIVPSYLAKADFGILLREENIINEVSSPLKFAEYIASGLPVLISKGVGDTEDLIRRYKIGVIIEKENSYKDALIEIIELIKDGTLHERCKRIAKEEFNINISLNQYYELYKKLCSY